MLMLAFMWTLWGILILFVWVPIIAIIISLALMLIDWFRK